jgi:CheY-like chemotaxis protein
LSDLGKYLLPVGLANIVNAPEKVVVETGNEALRAPLLQAEAAPVARQSSRVLFESGCSWAIWANKGGSKATMASILCVDDDDSLHFLLRKILSDAGHEVSTLDNGAEALEAVAHNAPDLLVLDLEMPGMSGFDVCRRVKSNPFTSRVPVLMLTAQSDVDRKIEGFQAGADDYLGKPFHPRELTVRVASLLRLVEREGDRNPSSGLPGGHAIERAIEARRGSDFAIVYVDLDHFKPFADAFGFTKADHVIRDTGRLLAQVVDKHAHSADRCESEHEDIAGHIGGDDFLIVTSPCHAESIAREALAGFETVVRDAVGEEAMQQGHFSARDREGNERTWPLAKLTATVVPIAARDDFSIHHLGAFAADLKRQAKGTGASLVKRALAPSAL